MLSNENRLRLDDIVSKMESNKEGTENIQFVVNDFKSKYDTGVQSQSQQTQQGTMLNGGEISQGNFSAIDKLKSNFQQFLQKPDPATGVSLMDTGKDIANVANIALPTALGVGGAIAGFPYGGPIGSVAGGAIGTAGGRALADIISTGVGAKKYIPEEISKRAVKEGAISAVIDVATLGAGKVLKPLVKGGLEKIAHGSILKDRVTKLIKDSTSRLTHVKDQVISLETALDSNDVITAIKNVLPDILESGLKKKGVIANSLGEIIEKKGTTLPNIKQDLQNLGTNINDNVMPIMNQAKSFFNQGYKAIEKKFIDTPVNEVNTLLEEIKSSLPLIADLDSNFIGAFNKILKVAGNVEESGFARGVIKKYGPAGLGFIEQGTVKEVGPGLTVPGAINIKRNLADLLESVSNSGTSASNTIGPLLKKGIDDIADIIDTATGGATKKINAGYKEYSELKRALGTTLTDISDIAGKKAEKISSILAKVPDDVKRAIKVADENFGIMGGEVVSKIKQNDSMLLGVTNHINDINRMINVLRSTGSSVLGKKANLLQKNMDSFIEKTYNKLQVEDGITELVKRTSKAAGESKEIAAKTVTRLKSKLTTLDEITANKKNLLPFYMASQIVWALPIPTPLKVLTSGVVSLAAIRKWSPEIANTMLKTIKFSPDIIDRELKAAKVPSKLANFVKKSLAEMMFQATEANNNDN